MDSTVAVHRYLTAKGGALGEVSVSEVERADFYSDTASGPFRVYLPAEVELVEEVGALSIYFGSRGEDIRTLKSDALVLLTLADGKLADVEILLDDKRVIKELSRALSP